VSGIIIVAMPISLLANNFGNSYRYSYKKDKVLERYYERIEKINPAKGLTQGCKRIKQFKTKLKRLFTQD
jgi:hypothetical protein